MINRRWVRQKRGSRAQGVESSATGHRAMGSRFGLSKKDKFLFGPAAALSTFIFSLWILPKYKFGDQESYRYFYEILRSIEFNQIIEYQIATVGGSEPIYGLLMWVGSALQIDKDLYISIFNSVMAILMFNAIRQWRGGYVFIVLNFMSFYNVVLLTSAERLKFGYLLLFLSLNLRGTSRLIAAFSSVFGHFQMAMVFFSLVTPYIYTAKTFVKKMNSACGLVQVLAISLVSSVVLYFSYIHLFGRVQEKITGYSQNASISDSVSVLILVVIGFFLSNKRVLFVTSMIIPILAVAFFGAGRANMIGVTVWLMLMVQERKTANPAVILIMLYFAVKTYGYMSNVLNYGDGFYGI